tara:strand:+ start:143 stop:589 length:447 start_codon:yes stop_codon:yes gene_type:complete
MRRTADRIRHAISFEIIGLVLITPLGAWAFDMPLHSIGLVALVAATLATLWNYVYNFLFDHAMLRLRGAVSKRLKHRIVHAVLFELGLLIILVPFIAWQLDISLVDAFIMDVSFALFYLVYAFVFNWLYDVVFPVPEPTSASIAPSQS